MTVHTETAHHTTSDFSVTGVCPCRQRAYLWMGAVCGLAEPIGEAFEALPRPSVSIPILCSCALRIREDRHVSWGVRAGHLERFSLTKHAVIGPLISLNAACHASPASAFQPPQKQEAARRAEEIYPLGWESFTKVWRSPPDPTPQAPRNSKVTSRSFSLGR